MLIPSNLPFPRTGPVPGAVGSEAAAMLAQFRPSVVSLYSEGSAIYAQGAAAGMLYYVEYGTVRLCRVTQDGRRQIGAFHFAGEIFGFESGNEYRCSAESVDGTGIRALRPNAGEDSASILLPLALRSLNRAQEHLLTLGRQNAVEKMGAFLLDLADRQGSARVVDLAMQRHDIADYLGLTNETISRVLSKLRLMRVIRLPAVKQIEILDINALHDMCG